MTLSKLTAPAQTGRERALAFLPAAVWYGVIFFFSAQTGEESGRLSGSLISRSLEWMGELGEVFLTEWDAFLLLSFLVRKAAHMGIFFVLTGLLFFAFWKNGLPRRKGLALSAVLCAVLATLDEFHQTFVPGRDGKLPDVLVDVAGGLCFLLLCRVVRAVSGHRAAPGT